MQHCPGLHNVEHIPHCASNTTFVVLVLVQNTRQQDEHEDEVLVGEQIVTLEATILPYLTN